MAVVGIEASKISVSPIELGRSSQQASKPDDKAFSNVLKELLTETNNLQIEAGEIQQKFLLGEIKDLHTVMVAAERASVAFNLVMEIRNKLLEGYQELMRMPV